MTRRSNMYSLSVKQWRPFVGCEHDCVYCKPSFQAQTKRWAGAIDKETGKRRCEACYQFKPHLHPERLDQPLPKTRFMQFIFTCSSGDVAFCPTYNLKAIMDRIRKEPDKTFLIQSKNPDTFNRVKIPRNVVLGTTIETNRSITAKYSEAPLTIRRYQDFLEVKHPYKMVTIEPVMEFDHDMLVSWILAIDPLMVWLGYDSKNCKLPEPPLAQVKQLFFTLADLGYVVVLKTIRRAWHEQ